MILSIFSLPAGESRRPQALEGSRRQGGDVRAGKAMRKAIKDIVCAYAYPRLDMEVSKKMNHLLKVGSRLAGACPNPQ